MGSRCIWIISALVVGGIAVATLQGSDGGVNQRPLDLPSGGLGTEEEEEDAPEVVHFYGGEYEGDGFFWCLDYSGSMQWGGRIGILKNEMVQAVRSLSRNAELNIVVFGTDYQIWSERPEPAHQNFKQAAIIWLQGYNNLGGSGMAVPMVHLIQTSRLSHKQRKTFIVVSDGAPNFPDPGQTLDTINAANTENRPINTIMIGNEEGGATFMQQLAEQNSGIFTHIDEN